MIWQQEDRGERARRNTAASERTAMRKWARDKREEKEKRKKQIHAHIPNHTSSSEDAWSDVCWIGWCAVLMVFCERDGGRGQKAADLNPTSLRTVRVNRDGKAKRARAHLERGNIDGKEAIRLV